MKIGEKIWKVYTWQEKSRIFGNCVLCESYSIIILSGWQSYSVILLFRTTVETFWCMRYNHFVIFIFFLYFPGHIPYICEKKLSNLEKKFLPFLLILLVGMEDLLKKHSLKQLLNKIHKVSSLFKTCRYYIWWTSQYPEKMKVQIISKHYSIESTSK